MDSRWFVYLSKGSSELMLTIWSEPWKPVWEWLELIDGLSEFRPPPSESTHLLLSKGHQQFGQFCGRPLVLCMRTHYKGAVASIRKNLPQTWGRKSSSGLSDFHWTEWNFSITRSFFFLFTTTSWWISAARSKRDASTLPTRTWPSALCSSNKPI